MKKIMTGTMLAALVTLMTACTQDDATNYNPYSNGQDNNNSGTADLGTGDLATFTISVDKTSAEPTSSATAYYPESEDNLDDISNLQDFETEVTIDVANISNGTINGVEITNNNGTIVCNHGDKKVCYVLSGTNTNGSVTITGSKKCEIKLNGVNITSPDSAALNVLCKKRCFIYLADGTTNTLTDTKCEESNEHKGALYCKGKLLFHGTGSLSVYGHHNNAIHSADYIIFNKGVNVYANSTANHGIKANDGIFVNGGIINVEVSAAAAKGINCESHVIINGGRTTSITTGSGAYDTTDQDAKGAAAIKADSTFTINDGVVMLKSTGSGGKGLSTDFASTFNGGSLYVITSGNQYSYSSKKTAKPKGIKSDGNLTVNGGAITIRTTGTYAEGIESKAVMTINNGSVASYSKQDDAINSADNMTISGGFVLGYSSGNDGIDANGNCYIKGGNIYAICSGSPEVAIDANTEGGYKLYLTGGNIIAIGGLENGSQLSQSCYQASWSNNTWYALNTGSNVIAFQTPTTGGSGLVVSSASTPSLTSGVTVSNGTVCFGGLGYHNSTTSGGSTVSLSTYTGGNMGGGMPGRPGR